MCAEKPKSLTGGRIAQRLVEHLQLPELFLQHTSSTSIYKQVLLHHYNYTLRRSSGFCLLLRIGDSLVAQVLLAHWNYRGKCCLDQCSDSPLVELFVVIEFVLIPESVSFRATVKATTKDSHYDNPDS